MLDVGLLSLALTAVPPVSVGPDALADAEAVDLPMRRVVVFPGTARITRAGTVRLAAGPRLLRLPLLPGTVETSEVRVSAEGARVLRTAAQPLARIDPRLAKAEVVLDRIEQLQRERAAAAEQLRSAEAHAQRIDALSPPDPPPEAEREQDALPTPASRWRRAVDGLATLLTEAKATARRRARVLAEIDERLQKAQTELQKLEHGGFVAEGVEPWVLLDVSRAGQVELRLVYEVDGPTWSPRYVIRHRPRSSQVEVELSAELVQATQETWEGAELVFSSASPTRPLAIPRLETWVLGEAEDLRLVPRPASPPPRPTPPRWPDPRPSDSELRQADRLAAYDTRRASLGLGPAKDEDDRRSSFAPRRPPPAESSPPPAAYAAENEAVDERARAEDTEVMTVAGSRSERAAQRSSARRPTRTQRLALFEAAMPAVRLPPGLPTEAGGADIRYEARTSPRIPSSPEPIRIPLQRARVDVTPYHRATPSLEKVAFLRASFQNPTRRPWLRGSARILVEDEPVGSVLLETTGPGGTVDLPLGRDERIEVSRRVVQTHESAGFLGGKRKEIFDVRLEVVNHLARPTTVEILEPSPIHRSKDLAARLERSDPEPQHLPDVELKEGLPSSGILRYVLELSAKGKQSVELRYIVEHGSDTRAVQE